MSGVVKSMFGSPATKTVVTEAPKKTDAEVQKAAALARQQLRERRGRASTILTSGMGVTSTAQTAPKTLLGE